MRYLKKYNESDNFIDNIEYLKDIFQELVDDNYNVKIINLLIRKYDHVANGIRIEITSNTLINGSDNYKLEYIYDYILTAKSYMKDNNFSLHNFEVTSEDNTSNDLTYTLNLYEDGLLQLSPQYINYARIIFYQYPV